MAHIQTQGRFRTSDSAAIDYFDTLHDSLSACLL